MRCPSCGRGEDRVVDSREVEGGAAVRRRRECLSCGYRFTTIERGVGTGLLVVKRSGEREPFDRAKLISGVGAACKNRPVSDEQIAVLARAVEEECRAGGGEVASQALGLAVLDRLRDLDAVAYLRFASVYKGFEDAGDFAREAGLLAGALTKRTAPKRHGG